MDGWNEQKSKWVGEQLLGGLRISHHSNSTHSSVLFVINTKNTKSNNSLTPIPY
jgi:hypothetical protein